MAGVYLMGGVGQHLSGAPVVACAWDGPGGDIALAHYWDDGTREIGGQVHVPHIVGAAGATYWVPERTIGASHALGSSALDDDHFVQGDREPTEETPILYTPRHIGAGVVASAVKLPNFLDDAVHEGEDHVIVSLGAEATAVRVPKNFAGDHGADLSDAMGLRRSASRFGRPNYHGLDLSGQNLSGLCLKYADLSYTNLSGVDLTLNDLTHADFEGANFSGARLTSEQAEMLRGRGLDVSKAVIVDLY